MDRFAKSKNKTKEIKKGRRAHMSAEPLEGFLSQYRQALNLSPFLYFFRKNPK